MSWLLPKHSLKMDLSICNGILHSPFTKCRYFGDSDGTPCCLKLDSSAKHIIDSEIARFLATNPDEKEVPLGDNCSGVHNGV